MHTQLDYFIIGMDIINPPFLDNRCIAVRGGDRGGYFYVRFYTEGLDSSLLRVNEDLDLQGSLFLPDEHHLIIAHPKGTYVYVLPPLNPIGKRAIHLSDSTTSLAPPTVFRASFDIFNRPFLTPLGGPCQIPCLSICPRPPVLLAMALVSDEQLYAYSDRVKDKVVVITGAANGIGRETALLFAKYGAKIVIGDRDVEGGEATAQEVRAAGGKSIATKCDVTVFDDQVSLFELAMATFGSVDIVVPNAGVTEMYPFDTVKLSEDGKPLKPKMTTLDVNLTGLLYSVHLAIHYLKLQRPDLESLKALVLIGSMASWAGIPKATLYSASKHAVLGVMRSLEPMLESENIRIGTIHPFFADTNIVPTPVKLFLAGIPKVPVPRIAGAIFHVASNPKPESSGSAWLLPDDGAVFQVPKEEFKEGVYKMIDERANRLQRGAKGAVFYFNLTKDLSRIFAKPLAILGVALFVGQFVYLNREVIASFVQ
ncbi:hypothetical protein ONZ45_g4912 [Pleurotus djamor]|nr:hypothetical protein ONZ45_g4912 [Pleurotus djamor]